MYKKIIITTIVILFAFSIVYAENYAVLITGDVPTGDAVGPKNWNGGMDPWYDEFWNDTFAMWEMLFKLGWKDENIYVLFGYGNDYACDYNRYWASLHGLDEITDYPAFLADVENIFDWLADGNPAQGIPQMTEDDFLFVWTFDHGSTWGTPGQGNSTLCLMDGQVTDDDFAGWMDQIGYDKRVIWMQQCFSGGFIDELENTNTVITTACSATQWAWQADDNYPDGDSPNYVDDYENERVATPSAIYHHGEFNYHMLNAVLQETVGYFNPNTMTASGPVDMYLAYMWEMIKDSRDETPQYSDLGNIGGSTYLDIPPAAPQNLALENVSNQTHLTWDANPEYDTDHYVIHRYISDNGDEIPQGDYPIIGTSPTNEFTDPEFAPIPGGPSTAWYKITAVDYADLVSPYSDVVGSHGYERGGGSTDNRSAIASLTPDKCSMRATPNPFNPTTTLKYNVNKAMSVSLKIYDVSGREVANIVNGMKSAGLHSVEFDGSGLSSGFYFAVMNAEGFSQTQKLLLIK